MNFVSVFQLLRYETVKQEFADKSYIVLHITKYSMPDAVLLALLFGIPLMGSFLVSYFLYKKLKRSGNRSPRLISILVFCGCYVAIFAVIVVIILNSIRLER